MPGRLASHIVFPTTVKLGECSHNGCGKCAAGLGVVDQVLPNSGVQHFQALGHCLNRSRSLRSLFTLLHVELGP